MKKDSAGKSPLGLKRGINTKLSRRIMIIIYSVGALGVEFRILVETLF
jgi:hypothetical protein